MIHKHCPGSADLLSVLIQLPFLGVTKQLFDARRLFQESRCLPPRLNAPQPRGNRLHPSSQLFSGLFDREGRCDGMCFAASLPSSV